VFCNWLLVSPKRTEAMHYVGINQATFHLAASYD